MNIVLVSMAVIGSQLVTPVSDKVPKLNVEATCKATVATDKEMGLSMPQSYDDCMRDENAAQDQLSPSWLATTNEVRHQCEERPRGRPRGPLAINRFLTENYCRMFLFA